MSDFLSTIAARSLGEIAQVTPRLLTRFEPDTGRPAELEELTFERDAPRAPLPAPGFAAPPPIAPQLHAAQIESPRALPAPAARLPDAPAAPVPGQQARLAALLPQPAAPRLLQNIADPTPRAAARSEPIKPVAARDLARSELITPMPAQPRPVADALATLLPRSIQPIQPVVVPPAQRRDTATQLAPALPLRDSSVQPPARRAAPETAPPPPTIQVTIGRIEVRATAPTRPTRAERATPAVMSLDDYLRQRDGGRR